MTDNKQEEAVFVPATYRYSAFYDLLADAVFQHRGALHAIDAYTMSRFARASILACALIVECVSNCLLASLPMSRKLRDELDKLSPLTKVEAYLQIRSIPALDRGDSAVQKIAELIQARNDHVHPKTLDISAKVAMPVDGGDEWIVPFDLEGEHWRHLKIPKRSIFWSHFNSLECIKAVSAYLRYVLIDLLRAERHEIDELLVSRILIGTAGFGGIFEETRQELISLKADGADFSYLGLD